MKSEDKILSLTERFGNERKRQLYRELQELKSQVRKETLTPINKTLEQIKQS